MIKNLCQYIENKSSLSVGTDIHVGHRTSEDVTGTVILERDTSDNYFDIPERTDKVIQALTREDSYMVARAQAVTVFKILRKMTSVDLPDVESGGDTYHVLTSNAISSPRYLGKDKNGRHEFSANYIVRTEET